MGLIIKDKIDMLMKGYPTVSDKYNVAGAVLTGNTAVQFGELVKFSATKGYYEAITGAVTLDNIAGFVLATNVKLAEEWPGQKVQVNPGEAFNLALNNTYMAIELDSEATEAQVLPNKQVHVILATGKLTTADKFAANTIVPLDGVVFTGIVENKGTAVAPKLYAEIFIK